MNREFLREGSIPIRRSLEGHGTPPSIEDYPFQGLDLATEPYRWWYWTGCAKLSAADARIAGHPVPPNRRAGEWKYAGQRTPLGTPVAQLRREGRDMLEAPCGSCMQNMQKCRCAFNAPAEARKGNAASSRPRHSAHRG